MKLKEENNQPSSGNKIRLPILLCWLVYTIAYSGRYSYSSNITSIINHYSVSHAEAGLVSAGFFFAYGLGQFANGLLCKRYNKRFAVALSLLLSSAINFILFLKVPFVFIKYLWFFNGIAQSVLWSTLISLLSENLKPEDIPKSIVAMSVTVPAGTIIIYGISSAAALFNGFIYVFLFASTLIAVSAAVWFIFYKKAFISSCQSSTSAPKLNSNGKITPVLILTIAELALFAVANNLIKDGLTTWIPSIFKENFGTSESISILMALILPVFGLPAAVSNAFFKRKISSFISLSGIWYAIAAVCMGMIIISAETSAVIIVISAFGIVALSMYAVNNVITSMAPLYMREKINSGLLAGILNGCCYIGSTISSYGLGSVADKSGWNGVFSLLFYVCLGAAALAAVIELTAFLKNKIRI